MKLSHLTIAVSVALGLAACGGSGDDAVDNSTPTPTPTPDKNPDKNKDKDTKPEVDSNGLKAPNDPDRGAPTGKVEDNVKPQVAAAKKVYVDRNIRDSVTGYNVFEGGMDPADTTPVAGQTNTGVQNYTASNVTQVNGISVVTSDMKTVQDNTTVAPIPFARVPLANRPEYANPGDVEERNNLNDGITSSIAARTYRSAGYESGAVQELKTLKGIELYKENGTNGQAGVIFYTGSTKANNPTNSGNGDLRRDASIINYSTQTPLKANGGIQANPNFSYAKIGDDYYRVIPENGVAWSDITPSTTFETVVKDLQGEDVSKKGIGMDQILFIPNAATSPNGDYQSTLSTQNGGLWDKTGNHRALNGYVAGSGAGDKLGTINIDPSAQAGLDIVRGSQIGRIDDYSVGRGEVEFKNFTLAGASYDLSRNLNMDNVSLDLSKVPSSRGNRTVNVMPIGLNYTVHDSKSTGTQNDDQFVDLTADAGALKIYDLPYSRALITINQAAVENPNAPLARASNMFGLAGFNDRRGLGMGSDGHYGPYQVIGYSQGTLPDNGRADYRGKSFGVNSEGDLNLRADFGITRASLYGSVTNRKRLSDSAELPDLNLKTIMLSQPSQYKRYASVGMQSSSEAPNGVVSRGSNANWGTWAAALYGPQAAEVGGVIAEGLQLDNANLVNVREVFSGERGKIIGDGRKSSEGSLN